MRDEKIFQTIAKATRLARDVYAYGPEVSDERMRRLEKTDGSLARTAFNAAYGFYIDHKKYLKTKATLRDVFVLAKERAIDAVRDELHLHEGED